MNYNIEILNNIDISLVARSLGIKILKGNKSICFIHNETKPSLAFFIETNSWYCFGCDNGGKVIDLVIKYYNYSFLESCSWLANTFKIENQHSLYITKKKIIRNKENIIISQNDYDYEVYEKIIFELDIDAQGINYLCKKRKLNIDVIKEQNIKSITNIKNFYCKLDKYYDIKRLIKAGLYRISNNGEIKPVWFRSGIVIPYYNIDGNIQTLQMRCYDGDIRYIFLNNIEICMFNEKLLSNLTVGSKLILSEGSIDTLSLLSLGIPAIGIPGAGNFKDKWIKLLKSYKVFIAFDNDKTGIDKANIIYEKLLACGISVVVLAIQNYKDINDMLIYQKDSTNG